MKLPLQFTGQLHEVVLINFSVSAAEITPLLPEGLKPRLFNGRAMISMVDVHLREMKASYWWIPFRFAYHHVAFRLLVEDAAWTEDGKAHGIHFLQSFTDRSLMLTGGNMLTDYRFSKAEMREMPGGLQLDNEGRTLQYNLAGPELEPDADLRGLQAVVGQIDRAYAVRDGQVFVTRIMREKWPLQAMHCNRFKMDFFESARFEGAFKVPVVIDYTWLPAQPVLSLKKQVAGVDALPLGVPALALP